MSKHDFISDHIEPALTGNTINILDRSNIHLGTAFEKVGKSDCGIFTSVFFQHTPLESIWDILNPKTDFQWSVEDARVVIWLELRFLEDPPEEPRKQRKPRQKAPKPPAKSTTLASEMIRPSSDTQENEAEIKHEPISLSLEGFPQDQGLESDSEVRQEDEIQVDHGSPQMEREEQAEDDEEAEELEEEREDRQAHQSSRKRPRAPTIDRDIEPLIPRRSQREMRATCKARASQSSK